MAEHFIGTGRVQLLVEPSAGCHIRSLCLDGWEVLATPTTPRQVGLGLGASFADGGLGGFDECIPSIAAEGSVPDHGDVWQRGWTVEELSPMSITASIEGAVLPYRLRRRVAVDDTTVQLDYRLDNLDDHPLELMWAAHPLFRVEPGSVLHLPARTLTVESSSRGLVQGETYPMRVEADGGGVLRWAELPARSFLKGFAPWPPDTGARLEHPAEGIVVTVSVEASDDVHLGVWWTKFGYPEQYPVEHLAIEPTFGSSDSRQQNIESGTGLRLASGKSRIWRVRFACHRYSE